MAHVNADSQRAVWTPANEDAIIAAVERGLCNMAQELGLSQPSVLEVLHDDRLRPYHYSWSVKPISIRSSSRYVMWRIATTSTHYG
jgi:hypothetical protein